MPKTEQDRYFTIFFIIVGVGVVSTALGSLGDNILSSIENWTAKIYIELAFRVKSIKSFFHE